PLAAGTAVAANPATPLLVTFTPTQAGQQSASWKVSPTSGAQLTILLQGNGFPVDLSVDPNPLDFGNVEVHASLSKSVTVTNRSSAAIDLTLILPDGGPFSFGSLGTVAGNSLSSGAILSLDVTYSPQQVETDSASFTVSGCPGCVPGSSLQVP